MKKAGLKMKKSMRRRLINIVSKDNRFVDKMSKKDLRQLEEEMLSNEKYYNDNLDDAQHVYNIITDVFSCRTI